MKKHYILIAAFPLICLAGCDLLRSDNTAHLQIQTEKNYYNVKEDESVEVTIVNKSSGVFHYSTCMPKVLEMVDEDNSVIETFGLPVCYCICPAELKPGESVPVHISSISTAVFRSQYENRISDVPATYRIRYSFYFDEAFGDEPVPVKFSRSNTFILTGFE